MAFWEWRRLLASLPGRVRFEPLFDEILLGKMCRLRSYRHASASEQPMLPHFDLYKLANVERMASNMNIQAWEHQELIEVREGVASLHCLSGMKMPVHCTALVSLHLEDSSDLQPLCEHVCKVDIETSQLVRKIAIQPEGLQILRIDATNTTSKLWRSNLWSIYWANWETEPTCNTTNYSSCAKHWETACARLHGHSKKWYDAW